MGEGAASGGEHAFGRGLCGAAGGIDLLFVVEFDDLGVVKEAGGLAGEVHHQDGADGEVGRDHRAGAPGGGLAFEPVHELG